MGESVIKMHRKQAEALNYLIYHPEIREVLYGGGKGGGKSFLGCYWILTSALIYPNTSWFIARENLTDLRKHTIPSIFEVMHLMKLDSNTFKFNGQDNILTFENGSRVIFVSTAKLPSDPMFERFGSMQNTGGFLEEAGEIDESAYQNLKLSIGRCNNEKYNLPFKLLITANPKKNWMHRDFIKKISNDKIFIAALAKDNHYLPSQYHETLEGIKNNRDRQRLLYGEWDYDDSDNSLVSFDKISDLFHNTFVKKTGKRMLSCDIALLNDKSVLIAWDGMVIIGVKVYHKLTSEELKQHIIDTAKQYEVPNSNIIYDGDGIGLYLNGLIPGALKFNNNGASGLPEFSNIKTRLAYMLADSINKGQIFIDCVLPLETKELIVEDLQCLKSKDSERKMELITKEEMKKIIGRSPDFLDAIMYRMFFIISRHY